MRLIRILFMGAAALVASVGVSAQTVERVGPVHIEKSYDCPDPAVRSQQHECCRIKVVIDENGKATSAKVNCTYAPLEPIAAQCQLDIPHEPRIRTGGKREGYTRTFTETHVAGRPKSMEEFMAMGEEANKRCDLIKDPE